MPRLWLSLLVLVSFALVAFGGIADVALQGQASRARETAAQAAGESARLVALSVRATLAQVEQGVLWGRTERSVVWERLASPPARAIPDAAAVPYSRRSRAELARLLHSTEATASGLPEAVVARLALGEATPVSAPGEMAPPDVSERLLSGGLPVRPEDLRVREVPSGWAGKFHRVRAGEQG